jgi:predicted deacylase
MDPYDELVSAWKALRSTHGVTVREVACPGAARTLLCCDFGETERPLVTLSAGVHGDEPAGPWSLLSLVRDGLLDPRYAYRAWVCTNPTGYSAGTRVNAEGQDINRTFSRGGTSPESRAIITANRDRRFVLSIDLHEDFEADGCYFYEAVVEKPPLAPALVRALDDAGLPIQRWHEGFDLAYPPGAEDSYRLERGWVVTDIPSLSRHFSGTLTYSMLMQRRAAARTLTIESARRRPWDERIAMHRVTVVAALSELSAQTAAESAS